MLPVLKRTNCPHNWLRSLLLFLAVIGIVVSASRAKAQADDPFRLGSHWKGQILQGSQSFPTTIYISDRTGDRIKGEIDFLTSELNKLTFQGNIVGHNTVVWITDKKEGNVTYPGLYFGTISGNQLSGTWQVPSANQYDRFTVSLVE
jgi:hypothetical protein